MNKSVQLIGDGSRDNFSLGLRLSDVDTSCLAPGMDSLASCNPLGDISYIDQNKVNYELDGENLLVEGVHCGQVKFQNYFQSFFGGDSALLEGAKVKVLLSDNCKLNKVEGTEIFKDGDLEFRSISFVLTIID